MCVCVQSVGRSEREQVCTVLAFLYDSEGFDALLGQLRGEASAAPHVSTLTTLTRVLSVSQ